MLSDLTRKNIVYIVHCVDAEGPLYEPVAATFERLHDIFGIQDIEATQWNLKKIQNKEIDLGGKEDAAARAVDVHLLNYNDSWEKINEMLGRVMSEEFRKRHPDSGGGGWVFNWHCVDHVGYKSNPRGRDFGVHKIFDYYQDARKKFHASQDAVHWHFHPMSTYQEAHRSATSYLNSPHLYEVLCRRIIEREWFPVVNRAGFHTERPDSHWFLEQWIPFDISNLSYRNDVQIYSQRDLLGGRFGDWRLAPDDWSVYHPSHDSYQLPGSCRRWIGRVLNLNTRFGNIDEREIEKAFKRAQDGKPTLLAVTNHDFRDMETEIDDFRKLLVKVAEKYPHVSYRYSEACEAFRNVAYPDGQPYDAIELNVNVHDRGNATVLEVATVKGQVFGPQPFLAIKTRSGRWIHDNFDFSTTLKDWSYTFDQESVRADDVEAIGVAANDVYGNQSIDIIRV